MENKAWHIVKSRRTGRYIVAHKNLVWSYKSGSLKGFDSYEVCRHAAIKMNAKYDDVQTDTDDQEQVDS